MGPWIASGIGIDAKQRHQPYRKRGFLLRLTHRSALHALADVHETTRYRPPMRRVFALDQHDWPVGTIEKLDDDIDGERRCGGRGHDFLSNGNSPTFYGSNAVAHRSGLALPDRQTAWTDEYPSFR